MSVNEYWVEFAEDVSCYMLACRLDGLRRDIEAQLEIWDIPFANVYDDRDTETRTLLMTVTQ